MCSPVGNVDLQQFGVVPSLGEGRAELEHDRAQVEHEPVGHEGVPHQGADLRGPELPAAGIGLKEKNEQFELTSEVGYWKIFC